MNQQNIIRRAFEKAAPSYRQAAYFQKEVGNRLFDRLDYLKINPKVIVDLGCGSADFPQKLRRYYKKSIVMAVDFSINSLAMARKKWTWSSQPKYVCSQVASLPLASQSVDLIFSNQLLHWAPSLDGLFSEINRVLKPNGVFLFTTLGPDTFRELRQSWAQIDPFQHTMDFLDMHDVGDKLLQNGLSAPVIDMEHLTVKYPNVRALCQELKAQGVANVHQQRRRSLVTPAIWRRFEQAYTDLYLTSEAKYPLTYEVIYGQAWGKNIVKNLKAQETTFPVKSLGRISSGQLS